MPSRCGLGPCAACAATREANRRSCAAELAEGQTLAVLFRVRLSLVHQVNAGVSACVLCEANHEVGVINDRGSSLSSSEGRLLRHIGCAV